jgi:hypothetical protein
MGSGHKKGWKKEQFKKLAKMVSKVIELESIAVDALPRKQWRILDAKSSQRKSEAFNLIGFALALVSWGWTVLAPQSSVVFGSILLLFAAVFATLGIIRAFGFGRVGSVSLLAFALVAIGFFDWKVVVSPQRGREFKGLLSEGYHLTDDCGTRSAKEPLPTWLRDKSAAWQAEVQQMVTQRLDPRFLQLWRGSTIMGFVSDSNMTAYQCTLLSVKVEALETIIGENFDEKILHQKYEGPLYWLESIDGKVDVTEALKNGGARLTIHEHASNGTVQITGKVPDSP